MLLEQSKIVGLPVGALDAGKRVAQVAEVVVSPEKGKILGYLLKVGFWPLQVYRVVLAEEVVGLDRNGLVVAKEEVVVPPEEIVRIHRLLKEKFHLVGLPVETKKTKKRLGRVYDFLIETTTHSIVKLYVKGWFTHFLIPFSQVVKIEKNKIVVKENAGGGKKEALLGVVEPAS